MEGDQRRILGAGAASVVAAFLWAAYYPFVINLGPRMGASGLIADPFLIGGAAYVGLAVARGHARVLGRLLRDPAAYLRVGLLVACQLSVLGATRISGPVTTSILSLLGDVVITPLLVIAVLGENRSLARSRIFVAGVLLSAAGGTLTIVGGTTTTPETLDGVLIAPVVIFSVAAYFLSAARANRTAPTTAIVAHSVFGAGLASLAISPWIAGGVSGLLPGSLADWGLVAALGLTSFFVAYLLYFASIDRAGLVLAAVLMSTIPVFTLLFSVGLLGLVPPWVAVAGIPIAVAGGILAAQGEHPPWKRRAEGLQIS